MLEYKYALFLPGLISDHENKKHNGKKKETVCCMKEVYLMRDTKDIVARKQLYCSQNNYYNTGCGRNPCDPV